MGGLPLSGGTVRRLFDHVGIRVSDREASERFYSTVLATITDEQMRKVDAYSEWDDFAIGLVDAAHPLTRGLHIGFRAHSREQVDDFWRAGRDAGYRDDGPPGPRPIYSESYYGSFLLDPDGNSAEAVHHATLREDGLIDHLWIRVADLTAAKVFYGLVAEHAGHRHTLDTVERSQFRGASGSFSVVAGGTPTENVHMAFPAPDDAAVAAFHEAMLAAGYRDNGGPGERLEYHPGYFGAFVLDPDGNNIELVNHNR